MAQLFYFFIVIFILFSSIFYMIYIDSNRKTLLCQIFLALLIKLIIFEIHPLPKCFIAF